MRVDAAIVQAGFADSKKEAQRLVRSGAVRVGWDYIPPVNNEFVEHDGLYWGMVTMITDPFDEIDAGDYGAILNVGKRRYIAVNDLLYGTTTPNNIVMAQVTGDIERIRT